MVPTNKIQGNPWRRWGLWLVLLPAIALLTWSSADLPILQAQVPGSAPFSFFKKRSTGPTGGFRYFRYRALSKYGDCGYPTDGGNSGLAFRWDSVWQTNAMTSNTTGTIGGIAAQLSASSEYSSTYAAWKLFDNLTGTDWEPTSGSFTGSTPWDESTANWVKVDFGAGNAPQITGLRIAGSYSYPDCSLDAWRLEGSDNDSTWVTIFGSEQTFQDVRATQVDYTWTWGNSLPPNPTSPVATVNSAAKISLSWTSGGGSTVSYRIAYQTGVTAPANCNTGVVENTASTSRAMLNLSGGLQYSFRICALNANSDLSTGVTVTSSQTPSTTWYSGVTITTSDASPYAGCSAPNETTMNDESISEKSTWGSETGGSTSITVDLGSVKAIRYLRIGGRGANNCWGGMGESYFNSISIDLSPDGSAWGNVPSFEFKYSNSVIGNIDIGNSTARYIKISKSGWLTTGQFRVGKDDCAGALVAGSNACWYDAGSSGNSCTSVCSTHGGYHNDTKDFAGSNGTNANCAAVADAVLSLGGPPTVSNNSYSGVGCTQYSFSYSRDTVATTAGATAAPEIRLCGCVN